MVTYEDIAKAQQTIESQFKIIRDAFAEAEKQIVDRRMKILTAIQQEQQVEASQLAQISESLKGLLSKKQL